MSPEINLSHLGVDQRIDLGGWFREKVQEGRAKPLQQEPGESTFLGQGVDILWVDDELVQAENLSADEIDAFILDDRTTLWIGDETANTMIQDGVVRTDQVRFDR